MFKNIFKKAPATLPIIPLTPQEIDVDEAADLALIQEEFKRGFDFIKKYEKSVTFFGSARFPANDKHYLEAAALAKKIVSELGYAVITGGGPGIMEAANKGAYEAGGESLGLTIRLPKEQGTNPYVKKEEGFYYFFTRKTLMTFAAEAYLFFPGGFGTLDEFFDILTLVQTNKIPKVPIILVGRDFWGPLDEYIKENLLKLHKAVSAEDLDLYKIVDNHDEVIETIKKYPVSNWWKGFQVL